MTSPPDRIARRRTHRRLSRGRMVAVAVAFVAAFVVGVAVGESVDDNDAPGGTQTLVRTLEPLTLAPATTTVTVTVRTP